MSRWYELAPGVRMAEVVDASDEVVAWRLDHQLADGSWCPGNVARERRDTAKGPRGWDTSTGSLAGGDLTTSSSIHSQSIKCHTHPDEFHGFVRDGKWVPA